MATGDYLPNTDSELLVWFNNFRLKFPNYASTLGFTPDEVTAISDDYQTLVFVVQTAEAARNEAQSRTNFKNVLRNGPLGTTPPPLPIATTPTPPATIVSPGIVPRLRAVAQRIKVHPNYSESIGPDLGLISTAARSLSIPTQSAKPDATATAEPNSAVRINWTKGSFDGVQIESQRAGESAWTLLGVDMKSPYIDTRQPLQAGQPELRRYRLRYLKSDEPVGSYSDEMTVTTTP